MPRHGDRANQSDATAYANRARTTSYCRRAVRGAWPLAHPLTSFCTSGGVTSPDSSFCRAEAGYADAIWPRHERPCSPALDGSCSSHRVASSATIICAPAGSTQAPRWMSVSVPASQARASALVRNVDRRAVMRTGVPVAGLVPARGQLPNAAEVVATSSWHVPNLSNPYGTNLAR